MEVENCVLYATLAGGGSRDASAAYSTLHSASEVMADWNRSRIDFSSRPSEPTKNVYLAASLSLRKLKKRVGVILHETLESVEELVDTSKHLLRTSTCDA